MTSGMLGEPTLPNGALMRNGLLYVGVLLAAAIGFTAIEYSLQAVFRFKLNASYGEAMGSAYLGAYVAGASIKKLTKSMELKLRLKLALFYTSLQVAISVLVVGGFVVFVGLQSVSALAGELGPPVILVIALVGLLIGGGVTYLMSRIALASVAKYARPGNQPNAGSTI